MASEPYILARLQVESLKILLRQNNQVTVRNYSYFIRRFFRPKQQKGSWNKWFGGIFKVLAVKLFSVFLLFYDRLSGVRYVLNFEWSKTQTHKHS